MASRLESAASSGGPRPRTNPGWWATVDPWSLGKSTIFAKALGWGASECSKSKSDLGITLHLLCSDAIYIPASWISSLWRGWFREDTCA